MSRIADALQRARAENPASDYAFDPAGPMPRQLAHIQIPWDMPNAALAPPPPIIPQTPPESQKLRELPPPVAKAPGTRPRGDEAVAGLIRNLFQVRAGAADRAVRRLLFTSVDDVPGSTDIAPRVAEALATQSNRSVCLADLDLHSPTLHRRFPVEGQRGFADAVVERGPLRACTHGAPSHHNLWLLPAGQPTLDVIPRLGEADIQRRLGDLLATFYYVIAYTAPIALHNDATKLGAVFDGVVLVADASASKATVVRTAAQSLEQANVRLLGTVLNHRGDPGAV